MHPLGATQLQLPSSSACVSTASSSLPISMCIPHLSTHPKLLVPALAQGNDSCIGNTAHCSTTKQFKYIYIYILTSKHRGPFLHNRHTAKGVARMRH